jgi:hypothetical protein
MASDIHLAMIGWAGMAASTLPAQVELEPCVPIYSSGKREIEPFQKSTNLDLAELRYGYDMESSQINQIQDCALRWAMDAVDDALCGECFVEANARVKQRCISLRDASIP